MKNTKKMLLTGFVGLSLLSGSFTSQAFFSQGEVKVILGLLLSATFGGLGGAAATDNYKKSFAIAYSAAGTVGSLLLFRDGIEQKGVERIRQIRKEIKREVIEERKNNK